MLGIVFGASYGVLCFVEGIVSSKLLTFLLDFILLVMWGFTFFAMLIAYNNGSIRMNLMVSCSIGFFIYYKTIHALLLPFSNKCAVLANKAKRYIYSKLFSIKKMLQKRTK